MARPRVAAPSRWQRFLRGKTTTQQVIIAVGALAGAVLAIAGVVAGALRLVGDDDEAARSRPAPGDVQQVITQTGSADDFVHLLIQAADEAAPLQLDHKVTAPAGDANYLLEYGCSESGRCSTVRLETPDDNEATFDSGVWFQGCWKVTKDGTGFGAAHLDLELRLQGTTCPSP